MGRFKLGSTVINLFAPGKVNLVEQLESLSVTKIGQPLAVSTETFVTPDAELRPASLLKRSKQNTTPAHWLTIKKTESNPSKETLTCA